MNSSFSAGQRGAAKLGCLSVVVLWAILGYLSYRIVPVYLEKDGFVDDLLRVAGRASIGQWSDSRTARLVLVMAKERNFEVKREDIQVKHMRGRPEVILIVNYRRTEMFPGDYQYVFHFRTTAQGSLGY